jgi:hypothetical protein
MSDHGLRAQLWYKWCKSKPRKKVIWWAITVWRPNRDISDVSQGGEKSYVMNDHVVRTDESDGWSEPANSVDCIAVWRDRTQEEKDRGRNGIDSRTWPGFPPQSIDQCASLCISSLPFPTRTNISKLFTLSDMTPCTSLQTFDNAANQDLVFLQTSTLTLGSFGNRVISEITSSCHSESVFQCFRSNAVMKHPHSPNLLTCAIIHPSAT